RGRGPGLRHLRGVLRACLPVQPRSREHRRPFHPLELLRVPQCPHPLRRRGLPPARGALRELPGADRLARRPERGNEDPVNRAAQLAGADARVTTAVWCWPIASSQPTVTLSPGLCVASALVRSVAEVIVFASTDVMVSPATMPAAWAGVPDGTPAITAPPVWVR